MKKVCVQEWVWYRLCVCMPVSLCVCIVYMCVCVCDKEGIVIFSDLYVKMRSVFAFHSLVCTLHLSSLQVGC